MPTSRAVDVFPESLRTSDISTSDAYRPPSLGYVFLSYSAGSSLDRRALVNVDHPECSWVSSALGEMQETDALAFTTTPRGFPLGVVSSTPIPEFLEASI